MSGKGKDFRPICDSWLLAPSKVGYYGAWWLRVLWLRGLCYYGAMNTTLRNLRYRRNFAARVLPVESGCWEWQGFRDKDGYGLFWYEGNNRRAHRVAYILSKGPVPEDLKVCHTCDNPSCVNPDHLWLGTMAQNLQDAYAKGRKNDRGSNNGWSKLTEAQVAEIRSLYPGTTQTALAKRFGVCQAHISDLVTGRRGVWKHVR